MSTKNSLKFLFFTAFFVMLTGCAPEVGSEAWCQVMNEKPKADWTANQAADYAKHCLFK